MARLWIVRHGATEWNESLRIQGQTDTDLSEAGRWQAERAAEALRGHNVTAAYASDLRRAWETAEIIAGQYGIEVQRRPELREARFGLFERLTFAEIQERHPQECAAWLADRAHVPPPGGESLEQLAARIGPFVEEVTAQRPDQEILVVAHGGPLRALLCLMLGMGLENYWRLRLDNGSISLADTYPEGTIVSQLNDTCHLGQTRVGGDPWRVQARSSKDL